MEISEKAKQLIEEKEKEEKSKKQEIKRWKQCKKYKICPDCGGVLNRQLITSSSPLVLGSFKWSCDVCDFEKDD